MNKLDLTPTEIRRIRRRRKRQQSIQQLKGSVGGYMHPIANTEDRYHEIREQSEKNWKGIEGFSKIDQTTAFKMMWQSIKNMNPLGKFFLVGFIVLCLVFWTSYFIF